MRQMTLIAAAVAALPLAVAAAPVNAQSTCGSRAELVRHLARNFHEAPAAAGIADNGALLEVFASRDGETWTVAVTLPNGIACLVATGQQWQEVPRLVRAEKAA